MPLKATKEIIEAKKRAYRERDDKKKENRIKTLAETRAAKRLQIFNDELQKPEAKQALRELQLVPLTTR